MKKKTDFGMCTGTFVHTSKSNIQAVEKHFNTMGLLICAVVKEVKNTYLIYIKFNKSEIFGNKDMISIHKEN